MTDSTTDNTGNTMDATTQAPAQEPPTRLEAGQTAPDFTLPAVEPDGTESTISLADLTKQGHKVILYFYPAAMTPGCTTEACDFRDNMARLSTLGYTVLGVSKDPMTKLQRFRERDHLSFPLLSDPELSVHKAYAAWGEKKLYGKTHVGVIRSTFAIDEHGVITLARYNVRAKGHVDSLIKRLGD